MSEEQIKQSSNYKVFLITSHQKELDQQINYSINLKFETNFKNVLTKEIKCKKGTFKVNVFSFEINNFGENNKDINSKLYNTVINLKYNKTLFEGIIFFKENRNNFIYDFKFQEFVGWFGTELPPSIVQFSKKEQYKIYKEILLLLDTKESSYLSLDLCIDSQNFLINQNYDFDFYLDILQLNYQQEEINNLFTILMLFDIKKAILPNKMNIEDFSYILNEIGKEDNKFIKYIPKNEEDKYYKKYYTLSLYLLLNNYINDNNKIKSLINNKNFEKYFSDILSEFSSVNLSEELFIKFLEEKCIVFAIIKKFFSFLYNDDLEKKILIINKYIDTISDCCINENQILNIEKKLKQISDSKTILNEIIKIINYQFENKKIFFSFEDNSLLNMYLLLEFSNNNKIKNINNNDNEKKFQN